MLEEDDTKLSNQIIQLAGSKSILELRNSFDQFIVYRTPLELKNSSKYFMSAHSEVGTLLANTEHRDTSPTTCLCGSGMSTSVCCEQIFDLDTESNSSMELKKNPANTMQQNHKSVAGSREKQANVMLMLFEGLHRELFDYQEQPIWKRRQLSADVIHYTGIRNESSPKTLIVGLAGLAQRLMLPSYRLLRYIDASQYDVLLLRDRTKKNFLYGIDGCGSSLDSICDYIAGIYESQNYRRAIAMGTSGGAIPAIYLAYKNEFSKALAIGPARLNLQLELMQLFRSIVSRSHSQKSPSVVLSYSSNVLIDVEAASEVMKIVRSAVNVPEHRTPSHNIIHDLNTIGALEAYLERHLLSDSFL